MKENQTKGLSILLLLISPLFGLFCGLKYLSWQNRKLIIILFFVIYGSLLKYGAESDAAVYVNLLELYSDMSISEFFLRLKHILLLDPLPNSPNDVYVHCLAFFSAGVVGTKAIFFPIVAGIYGYFYVMAMSKILKWENKKQVTLLLLSVAFLFIIHRSITSFQTVRTWTGMWILFNGVLGYHQTKNRKYLFLMFAAPLVHFAYLVIALPVFASLSYKKIPGIAVISLYILSFFTTLNPGGILNVSKDNSLAEEKVGAYYRENKYGESIDPIMERREKSNAVWYAKYGKTDSVYYGGHAFALFIILGGFYRKRMTPVEVGLFTAGLLTATLANFGTFSYAFYSRTMANAVIYILATVVLMTTRGAFQFNTVLNPRLTKFLQWVCVLIFLPKMVFFIAEFLVFTSIFILGMPFVGWTSETLNISIRELIGEIF
ncbi:MAG: hypothetical protein BM557_04070 [Flavobacterium sp. MedPE-SWcel]|uniref:hypothetical protein n=1 Tax=uncultured Flavobacterium sp. TaxID=165435 RepID=UPI00090FEB9B|nr:hypothetical protein [uncultured Flavobacterium sp.]OIQ21438.1 MAG: hypothetical protein BM557_04070 [Flavobacterium sp. MedPE-SWcel]